jgi:hypothetical protein
LTVLRDRLVMAVLKPSAMVAVVVMGTEIGAGDGDWQQFAMA